LVLELDLLKGWNVKKQSLGVTLFRSNKRMAIHAFANVAPSVLGYAN